MNVLKMVRGCFNVDLSVVFDDFEPFTINWWQINGHLFICISKQGRKGKKRTIFTFVSSRRRNIRGRDEDFSHGVDSFLTFCFPFSLIYAATRSSKPPNRRQLKQFPNHFRHLSRRNSVD